MLNIFKKTLWIILGILLLICAGIITRPFKYAAPPANSSVIAENSPPSDVICRISGTVLDHNQNPLPGAGVVFHYAKNFMGKTTTNENGQYSQDSFAPGAYTLTVSKPGFVGQSQTVEVNGFDAAADFQLKILGYSISGTVTASDGSAVAEAVVKLDQPDGNETITDGEGKYAFADLGPETYAVTAAKSGYRGETKVVDIVDADISADFTLPALVCAIAGTVTSADGTPLERAQIEVNGPQYFKIFTDKNGFYSVGEFPPGSYVVTASKEGYASEARPSDIADANAVADFALALQPRAFSGMATAQDGTPVSGVAIEINGPVWNSATTRNTGDFYFEGLVPGAYTVTVSKPGYIQQTMTMDIATQDVWQNFVLAGNTYTVSGIVSGVDGSPLTEARLELNGPVWAEAITDGGGRYSKAQLPPGTYVITASTEGFVPRSQTIVIADLDIALDFVLQLPAAQ